MLFRAVSGDCEVFARLLPRFLRINAQILIKPRVECP